MNIFKIITSQLIDPVLRAYDSKPPIINVKTAAVPMSIEDCQALIKRITEGK